jgi:hypothetical protein
VKPRSNWARMLVGTLALAVGLAVAAPPALAGQPPSVKPVKTPLSAAAAAQVAALSPTKVLAAAQESPAAPSTSSPSFFKTPKGIAALALLAAGVGYAAYSAVHDRKPVKSPIR